MEFTELIDKEGKKQKVPSQHFQINPKQQIVCIGFDFSGINITPHPPEGYECDNMGKLSEQGTIMGMQLTNSLNNYDWNFEKYPDPFVFLIQPKSVPSAFDNDEF